MAAKKKSKKSKKKANGAPSSSGCPWNANNLACTNTNGVLNAMEEIRAKFSEAKDIKMTQVAFWNALDSSEMRSMKANALSGRMDRVFCLLLRAGYEQGITGPQAIEAMRKTLVAAQKTICDLALVVDQNYRFRGEA